MTDSDDVSAREPTRSTRYRVTFLPADVTIEIDTADAPFGDVGRPGSILDIALGHGIALDHSCGGCCDCATCHCIVRAGGTAIPPAQADELARLRHAVGRRDASRLGCQAVPDGSRDVVVEIPETPAVEY